MLIDLDLTLISHTIVLDMDRVIVVGCRSDHIITIFNLGIHAGKIRCAYNFFLCSCFRLLNGNFASLKNSGDFLRKFICHESYHACRVTELLTAFRIIEERAFNEIGCLGFDCLKDTRCREVEHVADDLVEVERLRRNFRSFFHVEHDCKWICERCKCILLDLLNILADDDGLQVSCICKCTRSNLTDILTDYKDFILGRCRIKDDAACALLDFIENILFGKEGFAGFIYLNCLQCREILDTELLHCSRDCQGLCVTVQSIVSDSGYCINSFS